VNFLAEQNLKKFSAVFVGSALLTLVIFYLMQALIAVGDVELKDKGIRIADVTMPDRDLELLQDIERPEEEEPPPETMPPEFDMTPPADLDNVAPRPKFDFKGRKAGVFADGSYVPIFKVPPIYPRRAQERGIEGCVMLQFTVTKIPFEKLETMADMNVIGIATANPSQVVTRAIDIPSAIVFGSPVPNKVII